MSETILLVGINVGLAIVGIPSGISYGTAYSFTFTAVGGTAPYVFSQTGALPSGITFTDNGDGTATIAGTTTAIGSFPISIGLRDATRSRVQDNYVLVVAASALVITGDAPSVGLGQTGYAYAYAASGGRPPYTFSISSGSLPPGMSLLPVSSAVIVQSDPSPSMAGTFSFTVTVTDSLGNHAGDPDTIVVIAPTFYILLESGDRVLAETGTDLIISE
jgi:hypothetical protein